MAWSGGGGPDPQPAPAMQAAANAESARDRRRTGCSLTPCGGSARLEYPRAMSWSRVLLALALVLAPAAAWAGPFVLPAAQGRVVDEDTGEPLAGALVVEWWQGGGRFGEPQHGVHARFAETGPDGRFALPRRLAGPRLWLSSVDGPVYGFLHPSYGLVRESPRALPGDADGLLLAGSLRRSHLRLDELRPYCFGRREEDAAARRIVETACPIDAHVTWPTGVPRREGPRVAQGRRTGTWTFRRADASVIARGAYRAGGAVGDWSFFDPQGNRMD